MMMWSAWPEMPSGPKVITVSGLIWRMAAVSRDDPRVIGLEEHAIQLVEEAHLGHAEGCRCGGHQRDPGDTRLTSNGDGSRPIADRRPPANPGPGLGAGDLATRMGAWRSCGLDDNQAGELGLGGTIRRAVLCIGVLVL